MTHSSPSEQLHSILTPTDHLTISEHGNLLIEDCDATDLLRTFGSPLFVISEMTVRQNYRRIHSAFSERWPAPVNVMYAIKANNNPAIRAILCQEGAGGDCFGLGELHATFLGGADPRTIAMNGNYKSRVELLEAVRLGVLINIDSEEELDDLKEIAAVLSSTVKVALRLKVVPASFNTLGSDYFGIPAKLGDFIKSEKWGFSLSRAQDLTQQILNTPGLQFLGYTTHVGRFTRSSAHFAEYMAEFCRMIIQLVRETGARLQMINLGGGWPRQRDPESRSLTLNDSEVEQFADAAVNKLLDLLSEARLAVPELWLEPGRFIVGNSGVLLGTVGAIKRDLGMTWVTADFSTNNIMRIDTSGSAHHVLACNGMYRKSTEIVDIVGPTCTWSTITANRLMPQLNRGDPIAVLDVGMYAETASTQFNGVPRPATVLVCGKNAEIIKARETVDDVFSKCRIPDRLKPGVVGPHV
jgi:diaminopimelate decarboxylase